MRIILSLVVGGGVDNRGELPNGARFRGPQGLKMALIDNRLDDLGKQLIRKMLSYALGRQLEYYDEAVIRDIASKLKGAGYPIQDMALVGLSYPFTRKGCHNNCPKQEIIDKCKFIKIEETSFAELVLCLHCLLLKVLVIEIILGCSVIRIIESHTFIFKWNGNRFMEAKKSVQRRKAQLNPWMEPLEKHREDLMVTVSFGLQEEMGMVRVRRWLTGGSYDGHKNDAGGISADQLVAKHFENATPLPSLELSTSGEEVFLVVFLGIACHGLREIFLLLRDCARRSSISCFDVPKRDSWTKRH